jgi:hypothetical protein
LDTQQARAIFEKFGGAMAYVAVEKTDGTQSIGSAFHVGEGVFVTARHVVEGLRILEIATTERSYIDAKDSEETLVSIATPDGAQRRVHLVTSSTLEIESGPYFHPDETVDVAVFRVQGYDPRLPWVPLGSHLDDWLGESDFVLAEAIVLGYPPIPFTTRPYLVAARAEINAQVDLRGTRHVHFVVSATPRGGFSGGLAVVEYGFALGVITTSLVMNHKEPESGFFSVLTVEPILNCLAEHKLLPDCQAEGWDGMWNTEGRYYCKREPSQPRPGDYIVAAVGVFDDGKRFYLEFNLDDNDELFATIRKRSHQVLQSIMTREEVVRENFVKFHVEGPAEECRTRLADARGAAHSLLVAAGYRTSPTSNSENVQ